MGAEVTNTFVMPKEVVDRLKTYVKLEDQNEQQMTPTPRYTRLSLENLIKQENENNSHEWTPCRWSSIGWKYQKKGTLNKFLNSSFKINAMGGRGPSQTEDQLKASYFPSARVSIKKQSPEAKQSEEEKIQELKTKIDQYNGAYFSQPAA